MPFSRRHFLRRCSTAVAAQTLVPHVLHANPVSLASFSSTTRDVLPETVTARLDPVAIKQLALRGVEAGHAAGASYVDVRITRSLSQGILLGGISGFRDKYAVGIRCVVNGAWGFAANAFLSLEDVTRVAQTAAAQAHANAKANSGGRILPVEIPRVPAMTGDWTMPGLDPFAVSMEEKLDMEPALDASIGRVAPGPPGIGSWRRQERALATSDGSYLTQTVFQVGSGGSVALSNEVKGDPPTPWGVPFHGLSLAGRGWDMYADAHLVEQFPQRVEESRILWRLPMKPVDVGRYTVVMDAQTMASLVAETIGKATELDRVLGYEANAGGTSFLGPDPFAFLGSFQCGSPALTVMTDRSMRYGCATVQWDDEGVAPTQATLVQHGLLVDYQTTRQFAASLAPYYQKANIPVVLQGNAASASAMDFTMLHRPNLIVAPGPESLSLDDLIRGVKSGLAVIRGGVETDFQAKNGFGEAAVVREITNGQLGTRIMGAGILFNTIELWKNLLALGGTTSAETYGFEQTKSQPAQTMSYSVQAVPAVFKNVTIIDPKRKA